MSMRTALRFTIVIALILLIRIGWIFYSRRSAEREVQKQAAARQASEARSVVDAYGGDRLKILQFYSSPGTIRRGETSTLCYGVSNARSVHIEPPVEDIRPSVTRCIEVKPKKDTLYKLVAEDASGNTETATTSVNVR